MTRAAASTRQAGEHTAVVAGVAVDTRHWIGGQRVASPATFADISPIDETEIAQVASGQAGDASAAVAAAAQAFPGWRDTPPAERAAILHAVADGVLAGVDELAQVETTDNGSLLRSHRRGVMPRVAANFRFFADHLLRLGHDDFQTRGHRNHVSWDPAGVTAVITPWNAPLMLATWRVAPALAAGNTVVLKPPEWAPLTASLLADIAAGAGLPAGVLNVVQGLGAAAGAPLAADPRVRRISFTGSVRTARSIGAAAAANITPVSFELGGKSPLIVLDDADLDLAASLAAEQFDNAGQVCLAAVRILVQDRIADAFLDRFLSAARAIRQGDPRDEATGIGPLISRPHFDRVSGFVERALAAGASPLLGGGPNRDLGGLYFAPTVLTGAAEGSEILCAEVFGPVLTVQTFRTEAEAVALANNTRYGLAATLVTGDPDRAGRVSAQLSAGTVWVNCFFVRDLAAPFGGNGRSGIGREGGTWSFDFYCDVKNTCTAPAGWTTGPLGRTDGQPGGLAGEA
jgi:5-carboxymethyl-2-hydroxymuconic-semialdehyde dehydrogenase